MPSRDYYEQAWQSVPEGAEPSDVRLRETFMLDRLRAERARQRRGPSDPPLRVLDVGCGAGHFAAAMTRARVDGARLAEVVAIDVAREPLRRAETAYPDLDLDLRLAQPEAPLPLEDSSFDVVWVGETIEHVHDTAAFLSELRRVLRSGGLLLISTPDHGPVSLFWLALHPRRFAERFQVRSDHLRFYNLRALADLLEDFGFEDVLIRRAGGLPGARRLLLAAAGRRRF